MYLFANWKMYLTAEESVALAAHVAATAMPEDVQVALFPNTLHLESVRDTLGDVPVGAQNVAWVPQGAYTGATSAQLFADAGCRYALVGHSERRHIFAESNDAVRKKLEACLDAGLTPVLCIGETKEDRAEEKKEYRLKKQLMKAFDGLDLGNNQMIIAYEPVWAISNAGVGEPCDPLEVEETHVFIKKEVKALVGKDLPVIYGGSTNAENVVSYTSLDAIDGALIGHASIQAESWSDIVGALS